MLFDCLETVVRLMRRAKTTTGLRTTVHVIQKIYQTGQKATQEIKKNLRVVFDELLP